MKNKLNNLNILKEELKEELNLKQTEIEITFTTTI